MKINIFYWPTVNPENPSIIAILFEGHPKFMVYV